LNNSKNVFPAHKFDISYQNYMCHDFCLRQAKVRLKGL
jgi:hypothetical protein